MRLGCCLDSVSLSVRFFDCFGSALYVYLGNSSCWISGAFPGRSGSRMPGCCFGLRERLVDRLCLLRPIERKGLGRSDEGRVILAGEGLADAS